MPGGNKTQTTTTNNAPWSAAQPALQTGLNQATKLFNADPTGQGSVYKGSTVVPWSQQTQQAMGQIQGNAAANSGGAGVSGQYQDIINRGGLTGSQQNALAGLEGMPASGLTDAQVQSLGGLQALASNPYNAEQQASIANTRNTANSSFDLNANPEFQNVLKQAQAGARDSVNLSTAGAGRYGSGTHQGVLAQEVGDLTSRMVGQEYQNWQNRRDTANQNLFNMGQSGINTQMGANNAAAGIGQQAIANRANTLGSIFNMGQQGIGNLGAAYSGLNAPAQDLMQVGAMNEDLATRQKNDELRQFNDQQNAPWNQLARLNAIASGAGSLGGTSTQSQPGQNPFLSALGYGATGLGLLGGLF